MHPLLARLPLIRRPFYQRDIARQSYERAILERDAAVAERDTALKDLDTLKLALRGSESTVKSDQANAQSVLMSTSVEVDKPPFRRCVFCEKKVDAWRHFDFKPSEFLFRLGAIGSDVNRFWCPHCSSIDRERHLYLFLDRLKVMEPVRRGVVLHMAPEFRLREYIMRFDLKTYVQGDLFPQHDSIKRIDLQQIPFPDQTFDLVICNHMLEHVDDARKAMRELYRTLKPGARVICQTPYTPRLFKTLEDILHESPEDRHYFYGQDDHMRLFGADIEQQLQDAGFVGRLVPHAELLPDVDPELAGINEKEPFFDFVRSKAP